MLGIIAFVALSSPNIAPAHASPTYIATTSGDFASSSTWQGGNVPPGINDNNNYFYGTIIINPGVQVTFSTADSFFTQYGTVDVYGTLNLACGGVWYNYGTINLFGTLGTGGCEGFAQYHQLNQYCGSTINGALYYDDSTGQTVQVCTPAATTVSTSLSATSISTGNSVTDSATISGAYAGASGTVQYEYFASGSCAGSPTLVGSSVSVTDDSVPNSQSVTFSTGGSYGWESVYSGDSFDSAATSACEPLSVVTLPPSLKLSSTLVGAYTGTTITVTGTGFAPAVYTACLSTSPTLTSGCFITTGGYVISAGPSYDGAFSSTLAVPPSTPSGSYFVLVYQGLSTTDYLSASFTINQASSSVTSQVINHATNSPPSGTEVTGSSFYDTATVTGISGLTPMGTVTYYFFANGVCSGPASVTQAVTLSAGLVPQSAPTAALAAGQYGYSASYAGDLNYKPSTGVCEAFSVAKATPTTASTVFDSSTSAAWLGTEVTGSSAYDTSTVTGTTGFAPTGTVSYQLYASNSCSGTASTTQTETLAGGSVPPSPSTAKLAAGSYGFQASYSGDSNYLGSTVTCEAFSVAQAPSSTLSGVYDSTSSLWSGVDVTGSMAHDTSAVTGVLGFTPTGSVTYSFYGGPTCSGTPTTQSVTFSGGIVPGSSSTAALSAGSYSYKAAYGGDTNYLASSSACEPFTVNKATAVIATAISPTTSPMVWTSVSDTASIGDQVSGFTPSGTVTYDFYASASCSGTPTATTVTLNGDGSVPNSASQILAAGSYSYSASYGGDSNYLSATGACEPFTVSKASTTVTTTVEPGASNALGTATFDTAKIGGTVTGFAPTGTVTYAFYSASGSCTGASTTQTAPLSADGSMPNSSSQTLAGGSYSYSASYSGDSNYNASPTGACELLTVIKATATISTTLNAGTDPVLGAAVSDEATATGVTGFTPTGTVTITLYPGGSCTGTPIQTYTGVSLGSSSPDVSPNLASGTYSFQASAYSGDTNYVSGTSGSCEPFTVQTPPQSTSSLTSLVNSMNLPGGTANSLVSKLSAALSSINRGNDNAAVNQLNAFINEVNAQTGKAITQSQAQTLTYDARAVITALS